MASRCDGDGVGDGDADVGGSPIVGLVCTLSVRYAMAAGNGPASMSTR